MAIVNTILKRFIANDRLAVIGKSVLSGGVDLGGSITVTGLRRIEHIFVTVAGAAEQGCAIAETLPLATNVFTAAVEVADSTFYWMAIGLP